MEIYGEMERNFQNYMKGNHVPLLELYEEVSPGKVEILPYYEQMRLAGAERRLQVFFDRGEGFHEEDSAVYPMSREGLDLEIRIPEGVNRLRLDPGRSGRRTDSERTFLMRWNAGRFYCKRVPHGRGSILLWRR